MLVLRIAHRKWNETKQEPGLAGPGNMLACYIVSFHFLWAILSTSTVEGKLEGKLTDIPCIAKSGVPKAFFVVCFSHITPTNVNERNILRR